MTSARELRCPQQARYGNCSVATLTMTVVVVCFAITVRVTPAWEAGVPDRYVDCSAYFFMAANAKAIEEFNVYYTAGEYAFNQAVRTMGEPDALERFNAVSLEINELIERRWVAFKKADDRYGVVCADILRDASDPDR